MKLLPLDNYLLYEGKYLSFFKRKFLDKDRKSREYEYIERNRNQKAVVIIAQKENQILLIKQYRIPVLNYVVEFPAGLMDENEKIEQTTARELLEETGYRAEIVEISPVILTSAGLTTEQIYFVKVNLLDFVGCNYESSEDIEVFWVDKEKWEKLKKDNIYINGWVYAYLEGLYN